ASLGSVWKLVAGEETEKTDWGDPPTVVASGSTPSSGSRTRVVLAELLQRTSRVLSTRSRPPARSSPAAPAPPALPGQHLRGRRDSRDRRRADHDDAPHPGGLHGPDYRQGAVLRHSGLGHRPRPNSGQHRVRAGDGRIENARLRSSQVRRDDAYAVPARAELL